jgi:hypothetical protein
VLAVVLAFALMATAVGALILVARVSQSTSSGASFSTALHEVPLVPAGADQLVTWQPDVWTGGRVFEPGTRRQVEAAYIRAWAAIGRYQTTGDLSAVDDSLQLGARSAVLAAPRDGGSATWDLKHSLQLTFYSLDGATVGIRDTEADIARMSGSGPDEIVALSHEQYDAVLTIVDGYWRVSQLHRLPGAALRTVSDDGSMATLTGVSASKLRAVPPFVATEWRADDWGHLDAARVQEQFSRIETLGIRGVRLPLPFTAFDVGTPDSNALHNLGVVLDAAANHGIRVELVGLDGLRDLGPHNWVAALAQLRAIAGEAIRHPAVVAWDVVDRPDLRAGPLASSTEVKAFVVEAITQLRATDPVNPITVSWGSVAAATDPAMSALVDTISLHVDADPAAAASAVTQVARALPGLSVSLTVSGLSAASGWSPIPRTPTSQARQVADVLLIGERGSIGILSVGTAFDPQGHVGDGLMSASGEGRPSSKLFGGDRNLSTVPGLGPVDFAQAPFWRAVAVSVVAVAVAVVLWRRRSRRLVGPSARLRRNG